MSFKISRIPPPNKRNRNGLSGLNGCKQPSLNARAQQCGGKGQGGNVSVSVDITQAPKDCLHSNRSSTTPVEEAKQRPQSSCLIAKSSDGGAPKQSSINMMNGRKSADSVLPSSHSRGVNAQRRQQKQQHGAQGREEREETAGRKGQITRFVTERNEVLPVSGSSLKGVTEVVKDKLATTPDNYINPRREQQAYSSSPLSPLAAAPAPVLPSRTERATPFPTSPQFGQRPPQFVQRPPPAPPLTETEEAQAAAAATAEPYSPPLATEPLLTTQQLPPSSLPPLPTSPPLVNNDSLMSQSVQPNITAAPNRDYYYLSPQMDDYDEDNALYPWNISQMDMETSRDLSGAVNSYVPRTALESLNEYTENTGSKGLTDEMMDALSSMNNLLPDDFYDIFKLETDKERWAHINYLKNALNEQNEKWKTYSESKLENGEKTGKKRKMPSDFKVENSANKAKKRHEEPTSYTSFDMPNLSEDEMMEGVGGPLLTSSPKRNTSLPVTQTDYEMLGEKENANLRSQPLPLPPQLSPSSSLLSLQKKSPDSAAQSEPVSISPEGAIRSLPQVSAASDTLPPPAAAPLPLPPAPPPAAAVAATAAEKQKQHPIALPAREALGKRRLKLLENVSRGKISRRAASDSADASQMQALEDAEELQGVADVIDLPPNYNYDDYDLDFGANRKKPSKRKFRKRPKMKTQLNPKSTRFNISEPKEKIPRSKKTKNKWKSRT